MEIVFDLQVDRYGGISIVISDLSLNSDNQFLMGLMETVESGADLPEIRGGHADGETIIANGLQVVRQNIQSDSSGTQMQYRFVTHNMRMEMRADSDDTIASDLLEYYTPAIKCFRVGAIDTPEGRYAVAGGIDIEDRNELVGRVAVELPAGLASDIRVYESRVEMLLDYLSLANGRLLRWSVRKHYMTTGEVVLQFRGSQAKSGSGVPLFPHLQLRPAIEAALTNITPEEHQRLGLHVAISWMLLNSQYTEANFQGMMTALEHMLHVGMPSDAQGSLFPAEEFRSIRPRLADAIRTAMISCGIASEDGRIDELGDRICNLNYQPFRLKVMEYLDVYKVPAEDLLCSLREVVRLRNDIVHRGLADDYGDGEFFKHVEVARELLSRIFMTHMSYSGPYESYIGGNATKQFVLSQDGRPQVQ